MSKFNLLDTTDQWLVRPKVSAPRRLHLYPSEASSEAELPGGGKIIGKCARASFLRVSGMADAAPFEPRALWIMDQGKIIEQRFIDLWKEMGIWIDNNVKFYWEEYNLSGEVDVILSEPDTGQMFGVEVKTFYGYEAGKQIMGNKSVMGFPKNEHLMQATLYTYFWREQLSYFKLVYFARDDVRRREFNVRVVKEGEIWYPEVDGVVYRKFSVNSMLERYKRLQNYIDAGEVPAREYDLVWDNDRVLAEKKAGNVSKTAFADWEKGKRKIGDWQCRYCSFSDYCYNKDGTPKND